MAFLTVDVSLHGVAMSADSQPVEILGGQNDYPAVSGSLTRDPIVVRRAGGFVGLVGSVGTEEIEGLETAAWLKRFSAQWSSDDIGSFCGRLGDTLTNIWQRDSLPSVLEILVTGEVAGDLQFWYIRNSQGVGDGTHFPPAPTFEAADDLARYIQRDAVGSQTKDDVLKTRTYSFFQGVLVPGSMVFQGFTNILQAMYLNQVPGFLPVASADDLGYFARVRMEFLKRLCSTKHGIYTTGVPSPIGGDVHVYGVDRKGRVAEYPKIRSQVQVLLPDRP